MKSKETKRKTKMKWKHKTKKNKNMQIRKLFLTAYFWSISILALLITFPIYMILYLFMNQKSLARFYEFFPGFIILNAMLVPGFWTLKYKDLRKDKNWDGKRYVIVANHLSFIDSLVLSTLPVKKKYMIGKIFTKIPIFGTMGLLSGYVPVDRNAPNKMSSLENSGVHRAVETIRDGSGFCIFPEGMRNPTPGRLLPFKSGAYYIAFMSDVPILPVCLKGTEKAMPIGGMVDYGEIEVVIGEPFSVEAAEDIPQLINRTQNFLYNHL